MSYGRSECEAAREAPNEASVPEAPLLSLIILYEDHAQMRTNYAPWGNTPWGITFPEASARSKG